MSPIRVLSKKIDRLTKLVENEVPNVLVILDAGHGGVDPNTGINQTPSREFEHADGKVLYEGMLNRNLLRLAIIECVANNLPYLVVSDIYQDNSISDRVRKANAAYKMGGYDECNCIYLSIHHDATTTHTGTGIKLITYFGQTKSDELATITEPFFIKNGFKVNRDFGDGDMDFEYNLGVLRETKMPAKMLEFHHYDNPSELEIILNQERQKSAMKALIQGAVSYFGLQYLNSTL